MNEQVDPLLPGSTLFSAGTIEEIKTFSRGLDEQEVLDYYEVSSLSSLSDADTRYFMTAFKQGRALGKKEAVDQLFKQMGARQGHQASLAYLAKTADGWSPESVGAGSSGFSFKVVMP